MGGDRTRRYDPRRHYRRSIHLQGYDYTQPGAYFVTICPHNREPLFGRGVDGEMVLNAYGEIVWEEWFHSAKIRGEIELFPDEFVVMPNHVHGIVWIVETHDRMPTVGATGRSPLPIQSAHPRGPVPRSLGSFIAGIKSAVTRHINALRGTPGARIWQRNDYAHIIRNNVRANGRSPLNATATTPTAKEQTQWPGKSGTLSIHPTRETSKNTPKPFLRGTNGEPT